jgi:membrane protease subunit HflC
MKKLTIQNKVFIGIMSAIVVILLFASLYVVKEGEYKVVLRFGEAVRIEPNPGLALKIPFIENVTSLPKYQMIYDSKPTSSLTRDKKPIEVDNYTVWRISDARQFLRTAKTLGSGEQRIDAAVYNTVRIKLSEIDYGEIISEKTQRGNLNDDITKDVRDVLARDNYGIEIIDVRIKRTDLPQENKESVFKRMISDRQSIATKYLSEGDEESKKIMARADRQAVELKAEAEAKAKQIMSEGEQEAGRIYNEAYSKDPQFYTLYRTLESYLTTLKNEPVIMMPINSPYAKILLGN